MKPITPRRLVWNWDKSVDSAQIQKSAYGWHIKGRHEATAYALSCDENLVTDWVRVSGAGMQQQEAFRREDGWYFKSGEIVEGSAEAIDPDISCTALSNTMPIRRLGLKDGEARKIDVLYLDPPNAPKVARQRYAREGAKYHYKSLTSGFSALLTVDDEGIVTQYPGLCHLIEDIQ